jgi:drug/metabolite transporter (DMT)-like permease
MVPGMAMGYLAAAVVILPFASPLSVPADQAGLVLAHGMFILASAVTLAIGPRYITSAEVGLLVLLESVGAPLLAWAVIGENPGVYALVGGTIVVGALAVLNLRRIKAPS